ncbi:MAG: DUF1015 domain-containing protein [Deferrisomatales bacterium]|nr:DUF1015 domain-containing protein [Deferrisomatales bacterium]
MAEICAFRGIRYNPSIVGDLNQVITPPYDVIGEPLQAALYERSSHNMVRLDLGKMLPGDDASDNRYTRSSALFGQWLRDGVLRADSAPALYWLEEDYALEDGSPCTRKGFVASVRIEDVGSGLYRPHEKTHAKPREDRIRLTRACKANLSPIFSLYDDPDMLVSPGLEKAARTAGAPDARVTDDAGVESRMWCVTDPEVVAAVAAAMQGKSFFIADGHHRYETALAHRAWMRGQCPGARGEGAWNYVMMYLSNMRDPGLTVFPTHRAVFGLKGLDVGGLLERAGEYFSVEAVAEDPALLDAVAACLPGRQRFGLCVKGTSGGWTLTLRDGVDLSSVLGEGVSPVLRGLDVTVLHSLLIERLLGISEEAQGEQRNLRYIKGGRALLDAVAGEADLQLGFLLNPTRIDQVKSVAEAGERMPQKSTFFYPKLVTGLVLHPLVEDVEELRSL